MSSKPSQHDHPNRRPLLPPVKLLAWTHLTQRVVLNANLSHHSMPLHAPSITTVTTPSHLSTASVTPTSAPRTTSTESPPTPQTAPVQQVVTSPPPAPDASAVLLQDFSTWQDHECALAQLQAQVDPIITPIASQYNLASSLVLAVILNESQGSQNTISAEGAVGLMQLEPSTAWSLDTNPWYPLSNIEGGCKYLSQLLSEFQGDETLALSAYNAGPTEVLANNDAVVPDTETYVLNVEDLQQTLQSITP